MRMNDFVASCLFMDGEVLDKYCEVFDVDIDDDDVYETLNRCCGDYHAFGILILGCMFDKVIEEYKDRLDEEKFDYDFSSPSYPDFYYDGEHIESKDDLEDIIDNLKE